MATLPPEGSSRNQTSALLAGSSRAARDTADDARGLYSDYIEARCLPGAGEADAGSQVTGAVSDPPAAASGGYSMGGADHGSFALSAGVVALAALTRRRR
jgi:hypothetical protein